jgi:GT2 family glycosyltransferase
VKISVIIATRNRKDDLKICLNGFLAQTYKNFEIIVIDNQSLDGTKEMMSAHYPNITYKWLPNNINILAQNLGRVISDGEIIWRTDSDAHPKDPDLFQKVIDTFNKFENIDIISTTEVQVRNNMREVDILPYEADLKNVPEDGYKLNNFMGAGAAIRRRVFDKIGGFWEFGMEEKDFCTRALLEDFQIRHFPNFHTLHYASSSDRDRSNRWIAINKQFFRYIWKYYPFFSAIHSSIWVVLTAFVEVLGGRIKLSAIFQALFSFPEVIISTIRNERLSLTKEEMKKITMGFSIARNQRIYIWDRIKTKVGSK